MVHLPIGLFLLSFVLDLMSYGMDSTPGMVRASFYCLLTGVVGALLAAVPGFVDYMEIRHDARARRLGLAHMLLNLVAVGFYALSLGLRIQTWEVARTAPLPLLVSVIALGLIAFSGHLGGKMIYEEGVAVGRHRRRTPSPRTTRHVTAVPNSNWISAGRARDLADGETWRVNLAGTVMVIARVEGELFAFQEFCTHRFAPLSEGTFCDGQVICPWHGSQFDLRTGEVTSGPAKVALRTFEVEERSGEIMVSAPVDSVPAPLPHPA